MSVRPLTPALEKMAREDLNEDPKRLKDDLQSIKEWLAKQPHLKARTGERCYCYVLLRRRMLINNRFIYFIDLSIRFIIMLFLCDILQNLRVKTNVYLSMHLF